jgi:protein O-mannosyl-transferase
MLDERARAMLQDDAPLKPALPQPKHRLIVAFLALSVAVLSMAAFWPSLHNQFVSYDDPDYVTTNSYVLHGFTSEGVRWSLTALKTGSWLPLTWLSLMLDAQIWGADPWGFRLTNVLLHTASAVMLMWFLTRATGRIAASFFVAVVFAVHPLRAESVVWIAERKDVLSVFFAMAMLLAYERFARTGRWRWYAATLLGLTLSLMAKPMMVTAPALLLLLDIWPLRRWRLPWGLSSDDGASPGSSLRRLLLEKLPMLLLAIGICAITIVGQKLAGAVMDADTLPLSQRLANVPVSYTRYILHMVWFQKLAVLYPIVPHWPVWVLGGSLLLLAAITALACATLRRQPVIAVGWFWFLGTLVPVIGIVQVGSQSIADRYTYFPTIGLLIAMFFALDRFVSLRPAHVGTAVMGCAMIALLIFGTRQQSTVWRDSVTLYQTTIANTIDNPTAQNNLGAALLDTGRNEEAVTHLTESLRLRPDYPEAHNNLGSALMSLGRRAEAAVHYEKSSELNPQGSAPLNNLAVIRVLEGDGPAGEVAARRAVAVDPQYADAHHTLGHALLLQRRFDEAFVHFASAVRLLPTQAKFHRSWAKGLADAGRFSEAIEQYRTAAALNAREGRPMLEVARLHAKLGQNEEAINILNALLRENAEDQTTRFELGLLLLNSGQAAQAIEPLSRVAQASPNAPEVQNSLGIALAKTGRLDEAVTAFARAVELRPGYVDATNNLQRARKMLAERAAPAAP